MVLVTVKTEQVPGLRINKFLLNHPHFYQNCLKILQSAPTSNNYCEDCLKLKQCLEVKSYVGRLLIIKVLLIRLF